MFTGHRVQALKSRACRVGILFIGMALGITSNSFAVQNNRRSSSASRRPPFVAGRVLVKFRRGTDEGRKGRAIGRAAASHNGKLDRLDVEVLKVLPGRSEEDVVSALKLDPNVEFAELDTALPPSGIPNDPYLPYQWHLTAIRAPEAWDTIIGNSGLIIAILDTGVDSTHPDLAGKIFPGWNVYNNNSDTSDVYGHGTAVAGTAAAIGDNLNGVSSVAWNCLIMPIRISDANGWATTTAMANGLIWAADHGARVANISYAASNFSTVASAARYFQSKGGVVTMSSGNNGLADSASDNPDVLTVSATNPDDFVTAWSNTGGNIDVAAPGESILTTNNGGSYAYWSGTSFSAPIVAGVVALVLSVNPNLSGAEVQDIVKASAEDLGVPGWDSQFGSGRVNAANAVALALGNSSTPVVNEMPPPVRPRRRVR